MQPSVSISQVSSISLTNLDLAGSNKDDIAGTSVTPDTDITMDPTMGEFQWSLPQFNWYNIISFSVEYHQVTNISPDVWMNLPCQQVKTWLIS